MPMTLRVAQHHDIAARDELIPLSVRALQVAYYSPAQIEGAPGTVFAVDYRALGTSVLLQKFA